MKALKVIFLSFLVLALTNCEDGNGDVPTENQAGLFSGIVLSLAGNWQGTGTSSINDSQVQCNDVAFEIEQTPATLTVVQGLYQCDGGITIEWERTDMDIVGNTL